MAAAATSTPPTTSSPPASRPTAAAASTSPLSASSHETLALSRVPTLIDSGSPSRAGDRGHSSLPKTSSELEKADRPTIISFETPGCEQLNPRGWSHARRAFIATQGAASMLCVTFGTSAYTGGIPGLEEEFGASSELCTLGLSTFTLGLALGCLVWAPMSEILGRKLVLVVSLTIYVLFGLGPTLGHNMETIIITRFFMALGGASIMSNAPGMLSDLYPPSQIGLAMTINSVSPFLGPVLGPIIGGYVSMYAGPQSWRWVNGIIVMFGAAVVLVASFTIPETYPAVVLRRAAKKLEKQTGRPHVSLFDADQPKKSLAQAMSVGLRRPFVFLFLEPIVFLLSLYTAVVFGILYLFFEAFPVIFQEERGWSQGVGALPFLAMAVGLFLGVPASIFFMRMYRKAIARSPTGRAEPEERLYFAMFAAVLLPISLFWFAFTAPVSVPWPASVVSSVLFGLGMIGMMSSIMAYLSDTYTIYAASVFAGNSLIRYVFGAAFPMFGSIMFRGLTPRWALFLLAMLALVLAPMPFLFFKYGVRIRAFSKHVPKTVVPLPPPAPAPAVSSDTDADPERQVSTPPVFLTEGDRAVRVEELQDGIRPPAGQEEDLERLDSRRRDRVPA